MIAEIEWLRNICSKNGFMINESQLQQFERYVSNLVDWNEKINLISRADIKNIWHKHILGSMGFLFGFRLQNNSSMLDIGTGGGLPGIPLAILYPEIDFTLIDSINKKINAVKDIVNELKLNNVSVLCGRAEDLDRKNPRPAKFDYIISRAVAPACAILQWSRPLIKNAINSSRSAPDERNQKKIIGKGSVLLLKGGNVNPEIDEAMIKMKPVNISVNPIVIGGVDPKDFFDKKLIIINP